MKDIIEETRNAQMEEIEFAQKERNAKYFPFANQVDYMRALIQFAHPMHKEAMALNAKRTAGRQKVQQYAQNDEFTLLDNAERFARS